jgi:UDP-N-acetylmuramate dehydrogenase
VGATPVQNVGAYGVEVKDLVTQVTVYDTMTHEWRDLTPQACRFTYRDSLFKSAEGTHLIVGEVTFRLSAVPQPKIDYTDLKQVFIDGRVPTLAEIRTAIIAIRKEKFPDWHEVGTAGSFFKNPIVPRAVALALRAQHVGLPMFDVDADRMKLSLGYILDKVCHLKGYRRGAVGLYEKQALVVVNHGDATAREVRAFAFMITQYVEEATNVRIEPEVRYVE